MGCTEAECGYKQETDEVNTVFAKTMDFVWFHCIAPMKPGAIISVFQMNSQVKLGGIEWKKD